MPAPEVCNGKDDDCDSEVDNVPTLDSDPSNCGECGRVCNLPHADGNCVQGDCLFDQCQAGFVDLNQDLSLGLGGSNGCECQRTHGGVEICDGLDNDCNGAIDDGAMPGVGDACYPARGCDPAAGTCQGTCQAGTVICQDKTLVCTGTVAPTAEVCDGEDNDCNGDIDDGLNPQPCYTATTGCDVISASCFGTCKIGFRACEGATQWGACQGEVGPQQETCNGLDDDCNGTVDDHLGTDQGIGVDCFPADCPSGVCQGLCHGGLTACSAGRITCGGAQGAVPEVCDGADQDCDGVTDNGFDFQNDVHNCGACDNDCTSLTLHPESTNAWPYCQAGNCQRTCKPGFYDADDDYDGAGPVNGCEFGCDYEGPEVCDGRDNDCDGTVNLADADLQIPDNFCQQQGACANAVPVCTGYGPTTPTETGDALNQLDHWNVQGATVGTTDHGVLYAAVTDSGGTRTVTLYSDLLKTHEVAAGSRAGDGDVTLAERNDSRVSGSVTVTHTADDTTIELEVHLTTWLCNYSDDVELVGLNQVAPAESFCDGIDNECNGDVDDGMPPHPCYTGASGCNLATGACAGICRLGVASCLGDAGWSSCVGEVNPGTEVCNGLDDDCSGTVDDNPTDIGDVCFPADCPGDVCQGLCHSGHTACEFGRIVCGGAQAAVPEVCDEQDNDCDGVADNGFDKQTDVHHCGTCDNDCADLTQHPESTNAWPFCQTGACQRTCRAGWSDADDDYDGSGTVNGCEFACPAPGPEVCDGIDNDCDGRVDLADDDLQIPDNFCQQDGACDGSVPVCQVWGPAGPEDTGDNQNQLTTWVIAGANVANTDQGELYVTLADTLGTRTVSLYVDAARTTLVAEGTLAGDGAVALAERSGSGITGSVAVAYAADDSSITVKVPITTWVCNYGPDVELWGLNQISTPETRCDGHDNDCNGTVDDGLPPFPCYTKGNGCDVAAGSCEGICQLGTALCQGGGVVCVGETGPGTETCNGLDDDCNGTPDDSPTDVGGVCFPADCPGDVCQGLCRPGTTVCTLGRIVCGGNVQGAVPEVCDGQDNDCDGTADNGFDKQNDVHNCGACGNDCTILTQHPESTNAWPYCQAGACQRTCKAGWSDADDDYDGVGVMNGCEFACPAPGPEVCDGIDNDCDGEVDLADADLQIPANFCHQDGACDGAVPVCRVWGPAGPEDTGDDQHQLASWAITGANVTNTDQGGLHVTLSDLSGTRTVSLYLDAAHTTLVARGSLAGDGAVALAEQSGSGITGTVAVAYTADDSSITVKVPITTWVCNYSADVELWGLNQISTPETRCDGHDNDCNGTVDDGLPPFPCYTKGDGCDVATGSCQGICQLGTALCQGGGVVCVGEMGPGAETCNGLDDDCDGTADDSPTDVGDECFPADCPGDVCQGLCHSGTTVCTLGRIVCGGAVQGAVPELCDGLDNDCDGTNDNGFDKQNDVHNCGACNNDCTILAQHPESTNAWPYCQAGGCQRTCKAGWSDADDDYDGVGVMNGCEFACPSPEPEVCDGIDNDCDGEVDLTDGNLRDPGRLLQSHGRLRRRRAGVPRVGFGGDDGPRRRREPARRLGDQRGERDQHRSGRAVRDPERPLGHAHGEPVPRSGAHHAGRAGHPGRRRSAVADRAEPVADQRQRHRGLHRERLEHRRGGADHDLGVQLQRGRGALGPQPESPPPRRAATASTTTATARPTTGCRPTPATPPPAAVTWGAGAARAPAASASGSARAGSHPARARSARPRRSATASTTTAAGRSTTIWASPRESASPATRPPAATPSAGGSATPAPPSARPAPSCATGPRVPSQRSATLSGSIRTATAPPTTGSTSRSTCVTAGPATTTAAT